LRMSKVVATLEQLRSQRNVLQARLRAAEARLHLAGRRRKQPFPRPSHFAAVGMVLSALVGLYFFLTLPDSMSQ
jgi:hypothetical protein